MKILFLFSCLLNAILLARLWSLNAMIDDLGARLRVAEVSLTQAINENRKLK